MCVVQEDVCKHVSQGIRSFSKVLNLPSVARPVLVHFKCMRYPICMMCMYMYTYHALDYVERHQVVESQEKELP